MNFTNCNAIYMEAANNNNVLQELFDHWIVAQQLNHYACLYVHWLETHAHSTTADLQYYK